MADPHACRLQRARRAARRAGRRLGEPPEAATRATAFEDKIAAIGIRLKRWVSLHGIALNVEPDLSHFAGIVPCGVSEPRYGVTSLADLGLPVSMPEVDMALRAAFEDLFGPTATEPLAATASGDGRLRGRCGGHAGGVGQRCQPLLCLRAGLDHAGRHDQRHGRLHRDIQLDDVSRLAKK